MYGDQEFVINIIIYLMEYIIIFKFIVNLDNLNI